LIHNEAAQMLRLLTEFIVLFSVFWHTSVPSLYGAYLCVVQFGCFFLLPNICRLLIIRCLVQGCLVFTKPAGWCSDIAYVRCQKCS